MFERLGYTVDLANNGSEAVRAVEAGSYDVVFMDIQMPEMNGFEATQRIRETMPADRRPWIVALTANALEGDRETCLGHGMDDYLPKPIRFPDLERALRAVKRT
jgi:CheY-like chemotaxis protein